MDPTLNRPKANHYSPKVTPSNVPAAPPIGIPKRKCAPPLQPLVVKPVAPALTELERYTKRFKSSLKIDGDYIANHLQLLKQKASASGRPPTISEVLLHDTPVGNAASKYRSLLQPSPIATNCHPFGPVLDDWKHGVPVDCGPDWSAEHINVAIQRGPHRSALTPEALQVFEEDIAYQVSAGFSEVIPLSELLSRNPPNLKISPVALVPQLNRRGRIILDLSFPVRQNAGRKMGPVLQPSVNSCTRPTAPRLPVKMIGKVLTELFEYMAEAPPETDILFSKIDLSDGFWRMVVRDEDKYNFCYVLPQ